MAADVSRETLARLKIYAAMLEDWNVRHNLVSRGSLQQLWARHMWDCAQLAQFIPERAESLADLGSGAGFPGLILAELLRERKGLKIELVEATAKKCRFLEAVSDRLGLPITVRNCRIEDLPRHAYDVLTARACSPLKKLLAYAEPLWGAPTVAFFLKGQNAEQELTEARKSWRIRVNKHSSRSDPSGVILEIRELRRAAPKRSPSRT